MLVTAIPALWSAVHGFFTPAVLFVLLNIVIGTIAVTSKTAAASPRAEEDGAEPAAAGGGAGAAEQHGKLSRVPSMAFERLRSFNLSRFAAAAAPEPAVARVVDLGYEQEQEETPALEVEKDEEEVEAEAEAEVEMEHAPAHMERSRSEAAAEAELPRLPARLHKSASEKSAFAHFEAEDVQEEVESRRPATTREARGRRLPAAEPEEEENEAGAEEDAGEVDARADDFINRFHRQLKLQRLESLQRYRDTIRRGQGQQQRAGAAAAVGV